MGLSERLLSIRSFYSGQSCVYDIGCDHGHLGLSFVSERSVQEIHLVDPSESVIQALKQSLKDSDIPKGNLLEIHHSKGQELTLNQSIPKCLFIAGMGGKEISEIVLSLKPQLTSQDQIVVSPHRNVLKLRRDLRENHVRVIHERVFFEDNQFYPVFSLSLDEKYPLIDLYGEKLWHTGPGLLYLDHQIQAFTSHQDPESQAYLAFLKTVKQKL